MKISAQEETKETKGRTIRAFSASSREKTSRPWNGNEGPQEKSAESQRFREKTNRRLRTGGNEGNEGQNNPGIFGELTRKNLEALGRERGATREVG